MSNLSDYSKNLICKYFNTDAAVVRPTARYVALHTGDPGPTGSLLEVVGMAYVRQVVLFNAVVGPFTDNYNSPLFGPSTGVWGAITHTSIWDAVSGGNCLYRGQLATMLQVDNGESVIFGPGAIRVTIF